MHPIEPILKCRKCGKEITKFKDDAMEIFEGMHWLCFHFEYEHEGEPDSACQDYSCPNLKIEVYEGKLRELGIDPHKVLDEEARKRLEPE